jgi:hypothetical protein
VTENPRAKDQAAQVGALSMGFGFGWKKSHRFHIGQTPVLKYNVEGAILRCAQWSMDIRRSEHCRPAV